MYPSKRIHRPHAENVPAELLCLHRRTADAIAYHAVGRKGSLRTGPGFCPEHVDRDDVNPRPLSALVPSNGLIGCFSHDERRILAVAWEPYQELFQGVGTCIHSDFRIGGLAPGQTKRIRGTIYLTAAGADELLKQYEADFPEHAPANDEGRLQ